MFTLTAIGDAKEDVFHDEFTVADDEVEVFLPSDKLTVDENDIGMVDDNGVL